jgi:hypothetical protein
MQLRYRVPDRSTLKGLIQSLTVSVSPMRSTLYLNGFSDGTPACSSYDRHQVITCSRSYAVRERVVPRERGSARGVRVV